MKKFFHCEMPRPVVLLATLVQVAWLPAPEMNEYMLVHVVASVDPPGTVPSALVKNFVKSPFKVVTWLRKLVAVASACSRIDSRSVGAAAALAAVVAAAWFA